jgi:purine-binding chemotaxis protein CheW
VSAPSLHVTVRIEGERIGLPVARIKEILEPSATTRVPGAPKAFSGVVNVRGAIVPVVDLGVALGLRDRAANGVRPVVLLEITLGGEATAVGLAVDSADEIAELTPEEIAAVPAFGTKVAAHYLLGLARSLGSFVLLLDVDPNL